MFGDAVDPPQRESGTVRLVLYEIRGYREKEMSLSTFRRCIAPAAAAVLLCASTVTAQLTVVATAPVAPDLSKLDPLLQATLLQPTERSLVIVRAVDAASLDAVRYLVAQTGGMPGQPLPIIDALAADVPTLSLGTLTASPLVRRIALDRLVLGSLDRTAATVGAAAVRQELGYDGRGIGIAVIDSGITAWHADLTAVHAPASQRVDEFVDFVNGRDAPYDNYGHGTHVAGAIAGNGSASGGARTGIAPAATLTILKVLDGVGRGRISNVIAALGYVIDHQQRLNIRVANLSVGAAVSESYDSDLMTLAAKRVVEAGIVVVTSAGNGGRTRQGARQYGAITAPGNAPWVLTVGAASHMGTVDPADDAIADFSSRGPTAIDRAAKPDVVAPGVGTVSLSEPNSYLYHTRPEARIAGTTDPGYSPYFSLSGTSQAAPVVAGTVALMLQANPLLTPNAVKAIIQYTASSHSAYDALTQGAGFLNARGAVELARHFAEGSTTYVPPGEWSGQLIWGTRRVHAGRLTHAANAWALNVVWGATTTPEGAAVEWGVTDPSGDADPSGSTDGCAETACGSTVWRTDTTVSAENVVWGTTCGGDDCDDEAWSTGDQTVVWGTETEGDTVVWGTETEGDTVVWGTSENGTVIWGSSGGDTGECDSSGELASSPAER